MAPSFDRETPILAHGRAMFRGEHRWLLWPAVQYRVVTPLVHEPEINPFQRAMLGLAQAGHRDLAAIARLLGMTEELAHLVREDLRTLRHLDEFGAITDTGCAALDDGFLDPRRIIVTHIYQDAFTGMLWPAIVPLPLLVGARWMDKGHAEFDLGTAGRPARAQALAVRPEETTLTAVPSADDVIEAVSRGSRAEPNADQSWSTLVPPRVASRVSLMGSGQPVYLPVVLALADGAPRRPRDSASQGENDEPTWVAFTPFGKRPSPLLRRLVAMRCPHVPQLRQQVEELTGKPANTLLAEYDQLDAQLREHYREKLEQAFGPRLRDHQELAELLVLLERHTNLGHKTGNRDGDLNLAANLGGRIQEAVLGDITSQHLPCLPQELQSATPGQAPAPQPRAWQLIMAACEEIGLRRAEHRRVKVIDNPAKLRAAICPGPAHHRKFPELLAAALFSGSQGDSDHPVRQLARWRDTLLTDLTTAFRIRNNSSHGQFAPIDVEAVELSRRLAHETVAAYLGVPKPPQNQRI